MTRQVHRSTYLFLPCDPRGARFDGKNIRILIGDAFKDTVTLSKICLLSQAMRPWVMLSQNQRQTISKQEDIKSIWLFIVVWRLLFGSWLSNLSLKALTRNMFEEYQSEIALHSITKKIKVWNNNFILP